MSGQLTALGAPKSASRTPHGPRAGTPVPRKAKGTLARLMAVAGEVASEQERAAVLAEKYDQTEILLRRADRRVGMLAAEMRAAATRLRTEKMRLRTVAIEAYVTGQTSAVDDSILSNALGAGAMVDVYAQVATGRVNRVVRAYARAARAARRVERGAKANSDAIRADAAAVERMRTQALGLEQQASASLGVIEHKLSLLVGEKEFLRLVFNVQAGQYHGKNLAGTDLGKVASSAEGAEAVTAAKKLLGVPYVWGGASNKGVDCSGLTMLAWQAAGIDLEHSATVQWEESRPVPLASLRPGDLLFYHFAHDGNTPITHVVMYVGSGPYGRATIIQAAHTGTDVAYAPMFLAGLVSAGRP